MNFVEIGGICNIHHWLRWDWLYTFACRKLNTLKNLGDSVPRVYICSSTVYTLLVGSFRSSCPSPSTFSSLT